MTVLTRLKVSVQVLVTKAVTSRSTGIVIILVSVQVVVTIFVTVLKRVCIMVTMIVSDEQVGDTMVLPKGIPDNSILELGAGAAVM